MRYTEVHWLNLLGRWLLQTVPKPPKPILIYERRSGKVLESKLSLLPDSDSRFPLRPGAVATWNLVDRQAPTGGVVITLDNLLRLGKESKQIEIQRGLERSQNLTHRFQVSWVFKNRDQFRFIVIEAFDVDLSSHYIDEAPREIVRLMALEAFSMRPVPNLPWQERIYHFPWFVTISFFSPRKGCPTNPRSRPLCKRMHKVTFS